MPQSASPHKITTIFHSAEPQIRYREDSPAYVPETQEIRLPKFTDKPPCIDPFTCMCDDCATESEYESESESETDFEESDPIGPWEVRSIIAGMPGSGAFLIESMRRYSEKKRLYRMAARIQAFYRGYLRKRMRKPNRKRIRDYEIDAPPAKRCVACSFEQKRPTATHVHNHTCVVSSMCYSI